MALNQRQFISTSPATIEKETLIERSKHDDDNKIPALNFPPDLRRRVNRSNVAQVIAMVSTAANLEQLIASLIATRN